MNYAPKSFDIAGYTYNADIYCRMHIVPAIDGQAEVPEAEVEAKLDYLAKMLGIDRYDERSFDSGDFPKVIFESQACEEEHDVCGFPNCGTRLCEQ